MDCGDCFKMDQPYRHRILIVDDEPLNIELAAAFLKELEGAKLHYAKSGEVAIEGVFRYDFDLILLDINMPGIDGFQVCRMLKGDPATRDIPVIFLTAQQSVEHITRAFEEGGADYILKPFNGEELKARVRTQLKLRASIKELKAKQSKLAELSITDPLTQCYNLLFFQTRFKQLANKGGEHWLMRLHVGSLGKIDALMGYRKADLALREMAKILEATLYRSDLCARLYGAHFAVLAPARRREDIEKSAVELLGRIRKVPLLKESADVAMAAIRLREGETLIASMNRSLAALQASRGRGGAPLWIEE